MYDPYITPVNYNSQSFEVQVYNNWPWQKIDHRGFSEFTPPRNSSWKLSKKSKRPNENKPSYIFAFIFKQFWKENPQTVTKKKKSCDRRKYSTWEWVYTNEIVLEQEKGIFMSWRTNHYEMEAMHYSNPASGVIKTG